MVNLLNQELHKQNIKELFLLTILVAGGIKGAPREGAKGAEAPSLDKLKLRKKIKYLIVLVFFCASVI